jgi:phytol kinase
MLHNNLIALVITLALALGWLRLNDFMAARGWISSALSRKIIHIGTGPIFVLCWLLFEETPSARWLAALIPLGITAQFALVGLNILKDEQAVKAMSRSGERSEILKGPLYYGIAFVVLTLLYWKQSPIGIVALMVMCGGDGLADIIGGRYGSGRLPWSPRKTWAGSAAVFFGGLIFSAAVLAVFLAAGLFPGQIVDYLPALLVICLGAAVVESLPFSDVDNLTLPLTAALLGHLLF